MPSSRRHSKLAFASELNAKLGEVSLVGSAGVESIAVSGATVSTVQTYLAGPASVFPARSVARTSKTCMPSASAAYRCGLEQAAQSPPSRRHSKLAPASELNAKVAS